VAGRIPQDFIDDLVQRVDIVEIVGSRVQLKKAGREYKACCPFHDEKSPSFTVSPDKGFYHCFGCGAHGTAVGFLMEYERLEFVDAIEDLAHHLGLKVPRDEQARESTPLAPLYELLGKAAAFYSQALKEDSTAINYLKSRGLDGETALSFGLGFAPAGWDNLLRQFPDNDATRRQLLSAGMVIQRDNGGYYDRFRERIMFPIRDSRGRVIAFGGRVLGSGDPKYLNSPETPTFHKGRELYGLYETREAHRKLERILVVEGYVDVVSLACKGIRNVVATLGTATTPDHLRRLFRATHEVIFCFDGDRAGRDAAWRALQTGLGEMRDGRQLRFLFLPDGEDPDSLVQQEGREAFLQRLSGSMPLSDYLMKHLKEQTDISNMDGRARLAELVKPLLNKLPQGVYREMLTERLAEEVGLKRNLLEPALAEAAEKYPISRQTTRTGRPSGLRGTLVKQAIALLLHYPAQASKASLPAELPQATQRGVSLILELLEISRQHPNITTAILLERFRERPEKPHLEQLLSEEMLVTKQLAAQVLTDNLTRIISDAKRIRLEELVEKMTEGSLSADEKAEFLQLQTIDQNLGNPT